jgi:hypothetical protein
MKMLVIVLLSIKSSKEICRKLFKVKFIFIIDKDYTEFENIINQLKLKTPLN